MKNEVENSHRGGRKPLKIELFNDHFENAKRYGIQHHFSYQVHLA